MDTKRLIIAMAVTLALIFAWQQIVGYLAKKNPQWNLGGPEATTQPAEPTTMPAGESPGRVAPALTTAPSAATVPASLSVRAQPQQAVGVNLPAANPEEYRLRLSLSPRGAGIQHVTLPQFFETVDKRNPYTFQQPYELDEDLTRPLATRSATINGVEVPLANVAWELVESSASSATYQVDVSGGEDSAAAVRLRKTFRLHPNEHATQGYEIQIEYAFENLGSQPVTISTTFNGPTIPPRELDYGLDRQIVAGYFDGDQIVAVSHAIEEFTPENATRDITKSDKGLFAWAGAGSVYFEALLRPDPLEEGKIAPDWIAQTQVSAINPDAPSEHKQVTMTLRTSDISLEAGQTTTLPMRMYVGPRQRAVLNKEYYASLPLQFDRTLVVPSGLCGACTFQWLINLLVWMLSGFHFIFRDWGLAIIGLVGVVRVILHPITKKSQISMLKMGKMGPEVERLKKKFGDNKDELNKAMMELYKQQGFTPILGCLPMFLQMPIWIALWETLRSTFELRHAPFLYGLTWIDDLAKPDRLLSWTPIALPFGMELSALNVLPILLGLVFWLQQKYTPKPAAATKEQEQQQKMMQWMSLLFPVFLYTGPSGLNLYILTSTSIGILESKIVRDHIRQREEAEKAGRVIVDAKPTRAAKRRATHPPVEKKRGGLSGWLAGLQDRAEQLRREADRKK